VNHQLESRMREIRQSGSEGGGTKPIASPYPYQKSQFKGALPESALAAHHIVVV